MRPCVTLFLRAILPLALALPLRAQSRAADSLAVLAAADSALAAISRVDFIAFTDLMIPEATIVATVTRPGGAPQVRARTRETERATRVGGRLTERGFGATASVAGNVAMVWMPYDFYADGAWSHCGVDVFTFVRTAAGWRISSLAYSVEQPPACQRHPAGPPA